MPIKPMRKSIVLTDEKFEEKVKSKSVTKIIDVMPSIIIAVLICLVGYHFYNVLDENFEA